MATVWGMRFPVPAWQCPCVNTKVHKDLALELGWPAQSPDLNPTENLWDELECWLKFRPFCPLSVPDLTTPFFLLNRHKFLQTRIYLQDLITVEIWDILAIKLIKTSFLRLYCFPSYFRIIESIMENIFFSFFFSFHKLYLIFLILPV